MVFFIQALHQFYSSKLILQRQLNLSQILNVHFCKTSIYQTCSKVCITSSARTDEQTRARNYNEHMTVTDLIIMCHKEAASNSVQDSTSATGWRRTCPSCKLLCYKLQVASIWTTSFCHTLPGSSDKHVEVTHIYIHVEGWESSHVTLSATSGRIWLASNSNKWSAKVHIIHNQVKRQ